MNKKKSKENELRLPTKIATASVAIIAFTSALTVRLSLHVASLVFEQYEKFKNKGGCYGR